VRLSACLKRLAFKHSHFTALCDYAVGTNVGDISIWEVGSRDRLASRTFKVWDITAVSMAMQVGGTV
jgi:hypothetical protein